MEKYISKYKGAEIDAALDLANSALQPGSLTNYALKSQITELQQSINNKADLNGSAPDLIAGAAMSILRTRTSEDIEYSNEYIPAARMLVHAPDCTDRFGSELHVDDSFYPVIKQITGVSCGGNQMFSKYDAGVSGYTSGVTYITMEDGSVIANGTATATSFSDTAIGFKYTRIDKPCTVMFLCVKPIVRQVQCYTSRTDDGVLNYAIDNTNGITKCLHPGNFQIRARITEGQTLDNEVYRFEHIILDTLFPTDQSFVNSLGQNDAPKVLHRLGISSFTINP